jgi:hypothetical protein
LLSHRKINAKKKKKKKGRRHVKRTQKPA